MRCRLARQDAKYIAIYCRSYLMVSVYISSNIGIRDFNNALDELSGALSNRVDKLIIGGDFNAKSFLWGSQRTDGRGLLLTRWAAERDLRIVNVGNTPTCVRPQGLSIIDITWTSPDLLSFIRDWRVEEEIESLSDHLYISFVLSTARPRPITSRPMHHKCKGHEPEVENGNDVE